MRLAINRVMEGSDRRKYGSRRSAVIEADDEIDHMEKDIERLCLKLLLTATAGGKRSAQDFGCLKDDYGYGANRRSDR